jgi:hypothetical protein
VGGWIDGVLVGWWVRCLFLRSNREVIVTLLVTVNVRVAIGQWAARGCRVRSSRHRGYGGPEAKIVPQVNSRSPRGAIKAAAEAFLEILRVGRALVLDCEGSFQDIWEPPE